MNIKLTLSVLLLAIGGWCLAQNDEVKLTGKELFGDLKARQIGPALMSGRVVDLEADPTDHRIIYVGTAGGGLWKSNDGGATVRPIFEEYPQSIGRIAVDPVNPKIIWVGTGEIWTRNSVTVGKGLYRSVDGGNTWKKIEGFDNSERISSIAINPQNTNEIYVGVLGALWGDSEERGVYKSSDGGASWKKIFYLNPSTGVSDLVIDPQHPQTLYASMWQFRRTAWSFTSGGASSALYKSTDGGASWKKIQQGFPSGDLGRIAFALAPSNPQILYAAIEAKKDEEKGLYRSDDGGASWKQLSSDFGLVVRPFYFSRLVVDPQNPDVVVKAGLTGSISRDGGKTFRNLGNMHSDIHDILFDIKDDDRLYAATDGGVYRSWDGGNNFEIIENLPVSQFYHIDLDDKEPYNIYGGLQDNGCWYGPSQSPGGIEARDWNRVGYGDGFRVLKHPTRDIIYSEMQGAENVWRYDIKLNQQKTIQPLRAKGDPKLRFNWNAAMATSPNNPDRLYIGSQFLHRSNDMGDSWEKISPDLTTNDPAKQGQEESGGLSRDNSGAENHTTIFTIAESPLDENVIWVGTDDGNVQVTTDGGKNWTNTIKNISGLPKNTWVYHIEASNFDKGTAYAVFDGHTQNDGKAYVYKTTDFGKSWQSVVTPEIEGFARALQEDYKNPDLLFLGTEMGLYITMDGGKHWSKFTNNFPPVAVHYLALQKNTNDLVAATHGRGIIIIDDISPLREINQQVLQEDVHFFPTKPTIMKEESGFGGASTETQFIGPNPSEFVNLTYYLKKRHTFGKMTMEIQDMDGNTLVELPAGKSRGINVVTWTYSIRQPKVARGKSLAFGGFLAPRVLPGKYKAVLKKGDQAYETIFELKTDPTSLLTEQERMANHQVSMELYDMSQKLAYMVYEVDEIIARAEKLQKADDNSVSVSTPLLKRLRELKKGLVITEGDNYVSRGENQLREDITDLYSKIAGRYSAPTQAEMDNLILLRSRMQTAGEEFAKIKSKEGKTLEAYLQKNKQQPIVIKSYEEFIAS